MKRLFLIFILFFFLASCLIGGGAGSNSVRVQVAAFHQNSALRTGSGQPYIRLSPSREICRWRPFKLENVREQLLTTGIAKEILDDFLFYRETEGAEGAEGEERETSSYGPEVGKPVYIETGENWTKFGLQITNLTKYVLIIDTVRFEAKARCGSQIFEHSGEHSAGYCSREGDEAPYLYIVPPVKRDDKGNPTHPMVNYHPRSSNAFDNLTLIFDGFPIVDRTKEASKNFQNAFKSPGTNTPTGLSGTESAGSATERECQPNKTIAIPKYDIELILVGYFLLPRSVEQVGSFTKRIHFSTSVINF